MKFKGVLLLVPPFVIVASLSLTRQNGLVRVQGADTYDVGVVTPGKMIIHRFSLFNPASASAAILALPADCGCDTAPVALPESKAIAPQGTVGLVIKVWPHGAGKRTEGVKIVVRQNDTRHDVWLFMQYTTKAAGRQEGRR